MLLRASSRAGRAPASGSGAVLGDRKTASLGEAARRYARLVVEAAGYAFDPSYRTIAALAEANGLDVVQMDKPIARALRTLVLQNPKYSRNVKRAILALVSGAIDIDGIGKIKSAVAQAWFKGEPVELKRLKEYHISNRIARNNARNLLYEVSAWFAGAGYAGIAVYCDMSDFLSPSMTKGQSLDFYEIIRQLIDNVGLASNLFVLFATSPEFTTSEKRGIRSYDALGIRLADDFYDTQHPNPLAPLVELGGPYERRDSKTKGDQSLRCGVPNGDAVRLLQSNQPQIEARFCELLLRRDQPGFLIQGDFGSGKSHVLNVMREMALERGFACSIVPVGKDVALDSVPSLFRAAIRELRLPGKATGGSCAEIVDGLNFNCGRYLEF